MQSHNLWHRRGEAKEEMDEGVMGGERNEEARRKSKERRQEEWKINSKRARGRQVGRGRTLRYQQEEGG